MSGGIIADLIAEGVSPALIERVADALADGRAAERILNKRRTKDRERKPVSNPRIPRKSTEAAESVEIHVNGSQAKIPSPDPNHKTQPSNPPLKGSPPIVLPEHVIEAWNAMADRCGLAKAKLTPERRRKLTSQIRSRSIEDWTEAIDAVERSSFLRGENDRAWRADFDFLLQPKSFTKLTEGSYDRSAH